VSAGPRRGDQFLAFIDKAVFWGKAPKFLRFFVSSVFYPCLDPPKRPVAPTPVIPSQAKNSRRCWRQPPEAGVAADNDY
jgi:hypothetical protein